MLSKKEIVISLLMGMYCLGTAFCDNQPGEPDPFKSPTAFVEAYVVQIPTEALIEAGINPIGQAPEAISVTKVIWALLTNPEQSTVLSGGMLSVHNESRSFISQTQTQCIGEEFIEAQMSFEVHPLPIQSSRIQGQSIIIPYEYSLERLYPVDKKGRGRQKFPDREGYRWLGSIVLQSGVPAIAAATQNDQTVTFLILNATVQDKK